MGGVWKVEAGVGRKREVSHARKESSPAGTQPFSGEGGKGCS